MEQNTRRKPGTILECIGDVESYADCGKLLFAKGKQYVIQPDFSIIDETGNKAYYRDSELFKRRAFRTSRPRYFLVTYMIQTNPTSFSVATASVKEDTGKYINNKELVGQLKKINKIDTTLIITNVLELPEEDYKEFNRN